MPPPPLGQSGLQFAILDCACSTVGVTRRFWRTTIVMLLCLSIFSANGGWKLPVQLFAWAQMTYELSLKYELKVALQKVLSGKSPCAVCKTIMTARMLKLAPYSSPVDTTLPPFFLSALVWNIEKPRSQFLTEISHPPPKMSFEVPKPPPRSLV